MEGFPGLQLLLMLTGLLASSMSYLFPSPPTASLQNTGKSPKDVVLIQGTSLRIRAFCPYQYLQGKPVWCKEKDNECRFQNPKSLTELGWQYLTSEANQKIMLQGVVNDCIFLLMKNLQIEDSGRYWFGILSGMKMVSVNSIKVVVHHEHALQSEDTGIYWFGVLDGPNIIPLRKIRVIVRKEQQKEDIGTATNEDEQRLYQVAWLLVSIAVGVTIFATFMLVGLVIIKRKRKVADDPTIDDSPNCKAISLQIPESNTAKSLHKEMNTIYSIVKTPESSTDVNRTFPSRSNSYKYFTHSIDLPSPSGSVEYASMFF